MPAIGLGVGGYGNCTVSCDIEPLCFHSDVCYDNPYNAVTNWLNAGGRRIDGAVVYSNNDAVGKAIRDSKVPRSEIFFTNKIGSEIIEIDDKNEYNFLNINTKEDLEKAKKKIK